MGKGWNMNIKKLKEKIEFNSLYYRQEIVLVSVGFIVGLIIGVIT